MEQARAIDDLRAKGEPMGPLAGLPMTVKDTFDVAGLPASSGIEALRRRQAEDAVAVRHARRAGAVIWGKTNVPVMAGDWAVLQLPSMQQPTRTRPPGRPGGSPARRKAVAVAAGVTALEIGSDIGGSLRVPASFCGGLQPKADLGPGRPARPTCRRAPAPGPSATSNVGGLIARLGP